MAVVAAYLRTVRLFERDLRFFLVSSTLVSVAWDGVWSVLLNLYLLRLGYGLVFIGLANAVGALAFALFCPVAGALGTRRPGRKLVIIGVGLMAIGLWLLPVAEFYGDPWRMGWLLGSYVLAEVGSALYQVNGLPFMMAATGPAERYHAFSVRCALIPLAAFTGSLMAGLLPGLFAWLLGGSLALAAPYRLALWLGALLLFPGWLVLLRTRAVESYNVPPPPAASAPPAIGRPPYALIIAIGLVMALRFGGRATTITFYNVYFDSELGASTALIGLLSALSQLLAVPAALGAPLLAARWRNARIIFWGTLGSGLLVSLLALFPSLAPAGLAFVASNAVFTMTIGPIQFFSQELVAPRWRASMAAAFMMGAGLAFAGVSYAGGYGIVAFGYRAVFLAGATLISTGALVFWTCFRLPRGEQIPRPSLETR
jgi:hypothetical protein